MKKLTLVLLSLAGFVVTFNCRADITNATWTAESGGLSLMNGGFNSASGMLWLNGGQAGWSTASGTAFASSLSGDPTLNLSTSVNNDNTFAWAGYIVNVVMSNTFTLSSVTVSNPPVGNWSVQSVSPATLQSSGAYAGEYEATMTFADGTPVPVGGELDFSYSLSFAGALSYNFTQIMTPLAVPEPGTLALLACGGALGALTSRRFRKK